MVDIAQHIEAYFGMKPKEFSKIADLFTPEKVEKGNLILRTGRYNCGLNFIKTGFFRIYNIDGKSGKEITQWIAGPGSFITDISTLFFSTASRWNIEAISDGELLTISHDDYQKIGNHVENWPQLEKLFMAKCFSTLEDRVYTHLSMTSEERYRFFFNYNPELFNQVPLQYIASMLGMTPETFSRIRKKLNS